MLHVIDVTMPMREGMTTWPGLMETRFPPLARITRGDGVNVTDCHFCAHTGTHVDSPFHHYADGGGMETLNFETLMGRALVLDLTRVEESIGAEDLAPLDDAPAFDILLLRTKNSTEKDHWEGKFIEDYIYINPHGARAIVERGIRSVGIDCLSVEKYNLPECPTHKILLQDAAVTLIEGLDLRKVEPGLYGFICLPLKIVGSDGAPARALLFRNENDEPLHSFLPLIPS